MKKFKLISILLTFLILSALIFVSCTGDGVETTAEPGTTVAPEPTAEPGTTVAPEPTAEPDTTVAPDPTSAPDTTAEKPVDTTAPEITTEAPEVTTAPETEPPHVHAFGDWITVKAASCTAEGSSERSCSCGEKEVKSIPVTEHSFGELNTVKIASCTEEGLAEKVCSCGAKESVKIDKIAHRAGEWVVDKEATANAEGSKHQPCALCGAVLKTETIPVTPHVPGKWIVDKEATCTEEGSRHRVCTKCGETCDTEKLPAKGHKEEIDPAKAETCTESGKTEGKHCSVCNAVITAQQTIPAKGHKEVTDPAKSETCTESGKTEGKHCSVCNAVITAQQTIPAKGHKETDWIIDKEATLTSSGSKHKECSVCGVTVKTETIPVIEPLKTEYSVTVLDSNGSPISGIKVTFMSPFAPVGEAVTDSEGKASVKLVDGEYEAEIDGGDAYYISGNVKLTAGAPNAEIVVIGYVSNPIMAYPDEVNGVYYVDVGSVRVPVKNGVVRYYIFRPVEGAVYKVYTDSKNVEVGYYGSDLFVLPDNVGKYDEEGKLIIEFLNSSVGLNIVIGLKSASASVDECTLTIVRHSDIGISDGERPYVQYQADIPTQKTETPKGNRKYVDIAVNLSTMTGMNEIQVVYNEADGYYHLNTKDGHILYVTITLVTPYQEALSGIASNTSVGKIFYDDEGNFVKKEGYNEAIAGIKDYTNNRGDILKKGYAQMADPQYGVVPLDDDLIYILKNIGDGGWYEKGTPERTDWIFGDDIVIPANCWLFPVCYFLEY